MQLRPVVEVDLGPSSGGSPSSLEGASSGSYGAVEMVDQALTAGNAHRQCYHVCTGSDIAPRADVDMTHFKVVVNRTAARPTLAFTVTLRHVGRGEVLDLVRWNGDQGTGFITVNILKKRRYIGVLDEKTGGDVKCPGATVSVQGEHTRIHGVVPLSCISAAGVKAARLGPSMESTEAYDDGPVIRRLPLTPLD